MRASLLLPLLLIPAALASQDRDTDRAQLVHLHSELIRAHVEGRVDLWMTIEAERFVSVNGGRVDFPTGTDRREGRSAYLGATTFSRYQDLRDPIVKISDDGSLGWLIAEVEIIGSSIDSNEEETSFRDVWAWIELYEKTANGWEMVGNASNRR